MTFPHPCFRIATVVMMAISWTLTLTASPADEHDAMQQWQFTTQAVSVTEVSWTVDDATWRLESGSVRLMKPSAGGAITGFVFEGSGRFELDVADPFEVNQLRRFSGRPGINRVNEAFTRLVVRTSGPLPAELPTPSPESDFDTSKLAKDRHEKWLCQARHDANARVLAGKSVSGDSYFLADMDTSTHGWLMFEFEPWRDEEITLSKLRQLNEYVEIWVSMDRAEHRELNGRPGWTRSNLADLQHVIAEVDLSKHKGSRVQRGRPVVEDWARFHTTITIESQRDGVAAVQLFLHPWAEITGVSGAEGEDLHMVRDHIGDRFASIPNDVWDGTVTVMLGDVLDKGESQTLTFDYKMEILNFVSGFSWYPTVDHAVNDLHTARLELNIPKDLQAWAVGEPVAEADPRGSNWKVWEVTEPTMMVSFTFGKGFKEESLRAEGLPEVIVLGDPTGFGGGKMIRNVGADILNSLNFYKQYFGFELPDARIYATSIASNHGQAFDGFLHLANYTFNAEHPGASELFRAHEVAHQMWGHTVRWRSYRDQWLSESFAEYSAMLFVRESLPGKNYFDDILKIYTAEQLGSFKGAMSKFARPWDVNQVRVDGDELGPVAAGYRAGTAKIPNGGTIQLYRKGPLVLHMINVILDIMTHGESDLFRETMDRFLTTYDGEEASTEDFKDMLEEVSGKDWDPIFDSWIYGTGTPTYEWSRRVEKVESGFMLVIDVKQSGVADDFNSVIPVEITLPGNRTGVNLLPMNSVKDTFRITLPAKPTKVVLNPDYAVPARFKEAK